MPEDDADYKKRFSSLYMGGGFHIEHFQAVFEALEAEKLGEQYVLIGGCAVELWRREYVTERDVITTKDWDARAKADVPQKIKKHLPSPSMGNMNFQDENDFGVKTLNIIYNSPNKDMLAQFLDRIPGLDGEKRLNGMSFQLSPKRLPHISILDPISLFISKSFVQASHSDNIKKQQRNDYRHLHVLAKAIPPFLNDATSAFQNGTLKQNPIGLCHLFLDKFEQWESDPKMKIPDYISKLAVPLKETCQIHINNEAQFSI